MGNTGHSINTLPLKVKQNFLKAHGFMHMEKISKTYCECFQSKYA